MVKTLSHTGTPQEWLSIVAASRPQQDIALLQSALNLYDVKILPSLEKALGIADILFHLGLDAESLTSALLYPALQSGEINLDTITETFGLSCSKQLRDALQMQSLGKFQQVEQRKAHQTENLRKMILAMVTDVRAVLIILAERLWQLRLAKSLNPTEQKKLAHETLEVYAPLANRLGVWQIKWEMEDLCLRYIEPETYTKIAKSLVTRRAEREAYIKKFIDVLTQELKLASLSHFEISGRVKHIYSIYNKMMRKKSEFREIYDITAVRVLVDSIDACYTVLSILQNNYEQIPHEFDDYISQPKPNGYRSIHSVVIGPEDRNVEVQVRTFEMHNEAELGVASHWRYKEGILQTSDYEAKIALLRQVMAWQKEISHTETKPVHDIFADRVYVFTPTGEIVDLAKTATPLDFAYHIHSEVGHRCRGAKVDNKIVPLTYQLQTGQRVEILTAKQSKPSRDWLNPHLGFLNTQRARAKLAHWFREIDSANNIPIGREILDRELKKAGITGKVDLEAFAAKLTYKTADDVLAALGAGDIRAAQIIHFARPGGVPQATSVPLMKDHAVMRDPHKKIMGINNLLTKAAQCCKPLPGDKVIGYITKNRGVSVHRRDCANIQNVNEQNKPRFIEIDWDNQGNNNYSVDLQLRVYYHIDVLRDITNILSGEKINVLGLQTMQEPHQPTALLYLTIDINSVTQLNHAISLMKRIDNVIEVKRR